MNILITGGRSDMAQAMTKGFIQKGHEVIVTASSMQSKDEVESLYKNLGLKVKVKVIIFDFRNLEQAEKNIDDLILNTRIDGVILNAWKKVEELKLFEEYTGTEVDEELNHNIKAQVLLLQKLLPKMKENQFGRILNISSVIAISGSNKYGLYALGKAAIEGLIRNIAVDYGQYNILANSLRPGIIKTERTKKFWEREAYQKRVSRFIPQKKLGEAQQIANAAMALMEEDSYITGAELNVSGGLPLMTSG